MKKQSIVNREKFDLFVVMATFIVFLAFTLFTKQDATSRLLNIVVLVIMVTFLFAGLGRLFVRRGLTQLFRLTEDLDRLSDGIETIAADAPADIAKRFRESEEWVPQTEWVLNAIQTYYRDSDKLYHNDEKVYECDIADYINEDLINTVGNCAFNDFVSSVMTGLGILGTFVGLAFGLQAFNTETAEAMTSSIAPLIEGIKVAFYTSIFGVCFSLIYGTLLRNRTNNANQAVARFNALFYRYIGAHPEDAAMADLLQNEKEQTNAMNQFAEEISLALTDALTPMMTSLPGELASKLEGMFIPAMDKLLEEFVAQGKLTNEIVARAGTEGVGTIVENFVGQMDHMMGDQFSHLGDTIKALCEWQDKMVAGMEQTVNGIIEHATTLAGINNSFASTVDELHQFTDQVNSFHKESTETVLVIASELKTTGEYLESLSNEMAEINERDGEIISNVQTIANTIHQQESEIHAIAESQIGLIESSCTQLLAQSEIIKTSFDEMIGTLGDKCSNIADAFDGACSELTNGLNEATAQMVDASNRLTKDMDGAMDRTYAQFDSQLARAMEHFGGTLHELQTIVERTPKAVDSSAEARTKETIEYVAAVQQNQAALIEQINAFSQAMLAHAELIDSNLNKLQTQLAERGSER